MDTPSPFRFDYQPGTIRFGAGTVDTLAEELATQGIERALVCCGESVGATPAVRDPVEAGLGDRHAGTFAGTSARKTLSEAAAARDRFRETDADAFLALGGGSALDVAKAAAVLTASGQSLADAAQALADTGTIPIPDGDLPPLLAVPTTLAGADLSQMAGITAGPESGALDERVAGGLSDRRLMPTGLWYDPELFVHTPAGILAASAMNGFDKAVETTYAANATAVTDATAIHALRLCRESLPELGGGTDDIDVLSDAVAGIMLAQYGISNGGESTLSLIHAFGHGLTGVSSVQQGAAHGAVAPHALSYLFSTVDGRRDLLAEGLGVDSAEGIVDAVAEIRDGLGLPSRLADTAVEESALDRAAEITYEDGLMENTPPGLDATQAELRDVLQAAWE
ncbi:iron-containing alcohol dehydrogenase family protein [Halosegnis longus]|uniref:Iron-containing alcohol dehydrogenase n=1 Tax=Halosegnis longus TaxID=2216012 RepID=A0AAJ4R7T4_9EURY|nr:MULTISPECIES: iron-containing alcohol dehydrogenase family protein [Halobacteriales]RNJ25751.1 iron-containing alcohol dehydrogenase [Salella cibi]